MLEHEQERRLSVGLGITVDLLMAALTCVAAPAFHPPWTPHTITGIITDDGSATPKHVIDLIKARLKEAARVHAQLEAKK